MKKRVYICMILLSACGFFCMRYNAIEKSISRGEVDAVDFGTNNTDILSNQECDFNGDDLAVETVMEKDDDRFISNTTASDKEIIVSMDDINPNSVYNVSQSNMNVVGALDLVNEQSDYGSIDRTFDDDSDYDMMIESLDSGYDEQMEINHTDIREASAIETNILDPAMFWGESGQSGMSVTPNFPKEEGVISIPVNDYSVSVSENFPGSSVEIFLPIVENDGVVVPNFPSENTIISLDTIDD